MTSKISCFEPAVFRRSLRRTAPLWGLWLFLLMLMLPLRLYSTYADSQMALTSISWRLQSEILEMGAVGTHAFGFLYGLAAAWLLFFWLFRTNSAYFYASLPVRRETLFLTNYLTGLLIGIGPYALCALATFGATAALGVPLPGYCLQYLALSSMGFVFYFSFAVLLCVIVGQLAVQPVVYVILNLTSYVVSTVTAELMSSFVYGMPEVFVRDDSVFAMLSPLAYLLSSVNNYVSGIPYDAAAGGAEQYYVYCGWGYVIILTAVGLVMAAAALALLRKRDLERSGDAVTFRWLRPVFLYSVTLGFALVAGFVLYAIFENTLVAGSFPAMMLLLFIGALIGNLAARMLLKKSIHVLKNGWVSYGICCVVLLLVFGAAKADVLGYVRAVPAQEEVDTVCVARSRYGYAAGTEDPQVIADALALHRDLVENRREQEKLLREEQTSVQTLQLTYLLKNGKTVERIYKIAERDPQPGGLLDRYRALYDAYPLVYVRAFGSGEPLTEKSFSACRLEGIDAESGQWREQYLTAEETWKLLQTCILPDLQDSSLGERAYWMEDIAVEPITVEWGAMSLNLISEQEKERPSCYFEIPSDAVRTVAYFRSLGLKMYAD